MSLEDYSPQGHKEQSMTEATLAHTHIPTMDTSLSKPLELVMDTEAQRLVWGDKQPLGNAALGALFAGQRALLAGGFGSLHTPGP